MMIRRSQIQGALTMCVCVCVCAFSYYKGIRQMVSVSDQDMNTHLAEVSRVRKSAVITAKFMQC